jgi:serine/threonine protein kinase
MAQAPSNSAIHGDLKPGKVFLDANWEVRVADFGLARILTGGTRMPMYIGGPREMAPELYEEEDLDLQPADVFACGVLLDTIFTNQQLLKKEDHPMHSATQLMMSVMNREHLKLQPEIPDIFWSLIKQCAEPAPSARPSFDEIVQHLLTSDELIFPGTDHAKYREYQERITSPPPEVETADEPQHFIAPGGLKMSSLADGNRLLGDERERCLTKSTQMARGLVGHADNQSLKRYDFTRSSKRVAM